MSAYCTGHCLFLPGSPEGTCMHLDFLQMKKECSHSSGIAGKQFSMHGGAKKQEHLRGKKKNNPKHQK